MNPKEYSELLIKYYTDNNSFIEKAVFTVSAGATTFLLGYSDKINHTTLYHIAIWGFVTTLILQLISARISKEGCDRGLDKEHPENGNIWFKCSEIINNIFLITFILSIILAGISILSNHNQNIQTQIKDNTVKFEQTIKAKDFEYCIKKEGNNE